MKCFYHNDMDGKCAGAIVRMKAKETGWDGDFIAIDYKDDFPFSSIELNELIIIVDFSLQKPGEFEKLLEITGSVLWIDHHKTAIERHGHLLHAVPGIREIGKAGCVLTWHWFYPWKKLPRAVELIGDYDVWAFKHGEDTKLFQAGIQLEETHPESSLWESLLEEDAKVTPIIEQGKTALKYRENYYKDLIKSVAFFTEFEGYKAVACNAGLVNSMLFDSVEEDYDLMMPFYFDGRVWTVSIYTENDDIDCSELAKKYGGGGHRKAAGFQCEKLPFTTRLFCTSGDGGA